MHSTWQNHVWQPSPSYSWRGCRFQAFSFALRFFTGLGARDDWPMYVWVLRHNSFFFVHMCCPLLGSCHQQARVRRWLLFFISNFLSPSWPNILNFPVTCPGWLFIFAQQQSSESVWNNRSMKVFLLQHNTPVPTGQFNGTAVRVPNNDLLCTRRGCRCLKQDLERLDKKLILNVLVEEKKEGIRCSGLYLRKMTNANTRKIMWCFIFRSLK